MPILRPGVVAPVSRAAAACCGSPVRVAVHRIDDSYNRFDYNRADVAPILEEVELAEAIDIDETRSFERHVQRTALSPPKLLITGARPRRIRFGSQIGHPRHVVKLVNFDTFVPSARVYARAYTVEKQGTSPTSPVAGGRMVAFSGIAARRTAYACRLSGGCSFSGFPVSIDRQFP